MVNQFASSKNKDTQPAAEDPIRLSRYSFPHIPGPNRPSPVRDLSPIMKSRLRIVTEHFGTSGDGMSPEDVAKQEGHGFKLRVVQTFKLLKLAGLLQFRYDPSNVPLYRREHIPTGLARDLYLAGKLKPPE